MRRTAVALALCAVAAVMPSAGAATTPQIVDPKGDYPNEAADIVSVLFSTPKAGNKLVIVMELAAAANEPLPYGYQVTFEAGDCVWRGNYFGANAETGGGCRDDDSAPPSAVKVDGNTVTFTVPATGRLKRGTKLTALAANDSIGGVLVGGGAENTGDLASSDTTYVVGT